MKIRNLLVGLLAGLGAITANASSTPVIGAVSTEGFSSLRNLVQNSGFEPNIGTTFWTASGGSLSTTTTAANVGRGSQSATWDSNAASQTLRSAQVTIPAGMYGKNAIARCLFQTPSGSATHTIAAYDGTTEYNATTIASSTAYTYTTINFIMPSSGTIGISIDSVASNEPNINIDDCQISLADNLSSVSQANLVASGYFATTGSCSVSRTNTSLGGFTTTAACTGPTVENNPGPGTLLTTDVDLPTKFTINNLPPATYKVTFIGPIKIATSAQQGAFAINDGTTTFGQTGVTFSNTTGQQFIESGIITYTTAGNRTFELYESSAANAVTIDISASNQQVYFFVEKYPNAAQQVYSPAQVPANFSATHDSTCSWARTNAAYGDPAADATCNFTVNTNVNMGTVTSYQSAGNNLPGFVWTPPRLGRYKITAVFQLEGATSTGFYSARMWDGTTLIAGSEYRAAQSSDYKPFTLVGDYNVTSISSKTISIQIAGSTGAATVVAANLDANAIYWTVVEEDAPMPAPYLTGSVTSPSSGQESAIRANMTCSSGSAINHQDGTAFTSIGNVASGKCSVVIPSATFSSTAYDCSILRNGTAVTSITGFSINNKTSTGFDIYMAAISTGSSTIAAGTSESFDILCRGPH